jgi:hypothetical protein
MQSCASTGTLCTALSTHIALQKATVHVPPVSACTRMYSGTCTVVSPYISLKNLKFMNPYTGLYRYVSPCIGKHRHVPACTKMYRRVLRYMSVHGFMNSTFFRDIYGDKYKGIILHCKIRQYTLCSD